MPQYHESAASREARERQERARQMDPLGLLDSDEDERETARDW